MAEESVSQPLPPPGPQLDFRQWTKAVHRRIRSYLTDVQVDGTDNEVSWVRGTLRVYIVKSASVWWVHFERNRSFAVPPIYVSRFDAFTAGNVADTMLGFFEPELSVPNKPSPKKPPAPQ